LSLYKRNGIWWINVRANGIRQRISSGTHNRKLAEMVNAKVLSDIQAGRWFPIREKRMFPELVERYMSEHSRVHKAPSSTIRDESSFKHLTDNFGTFSLTEITPARISEYKARRRTDGIKPATLARELEVLRHALNLAVREWEWIEHSPFEKARIDRVDNKVERWITPEEELRLLSEAAPWVQEIIIFALNTGMRQAEILSLQWGQVDGVRKTATALRTKNKEKRTIPLNETVITLLTPKYRANSPAEYVFTSQAGTKINARNLLRAYYTARKKAKLEDVRFHDLRHTFATRLVQSGIDLYVVKELLGHKTITMTMRYAHHYPESLRHGVDVLNGYGHKTVTTAFSGKEKGLENSL